MTARSMRIRRGDRLIAAVFMLFVAVALAGLIANDTGASFTATTANQSNTLQTLTVLPPAAQNATSSAAGGAVNLSWTATPTVPGAGHALAYLVLRGPVGGPYAQVGTTTALSFADTPPSDGTYEYVIEAQVTGGGSFTSAPTAPQSGVSDRTAPTTPTGVTLVSGPNGNPRTVELSWTASTDATSGVGSYEVRWTNPVTGACPAANTTSYPNVGTTTTTAYSIAGTVNSAYCAYVVAIDAVGNRGADSAVAGPTTAK